MKKPLVLITLSICNIAAAQTVAAPDPAVQAYIDAEMKSLEFPLSYQGDIGPSALVGQAAELFKAWSDSNGNPQIHTQNLDKSAMSVAGHAYWAIVAGGTTSELGGQFTNYIAVADPTTGNLVAEGSVPPMPIKWESELKIAPIAAPAQYKPILKPVTPAQTSALFIQEWEGEFDEVPIKNETYSGSDARGEPLKMAWNAEKGSLSVNFLKAGKTVAAFDLTPASKIVGSNYDQFENDTEGNYLVVQTDKATLWVHSFEGNSVIRIQSGAELNEFDFDIDH